MINLISKAAIMSGLQSFLVIWVMGKCEFIGVERWTGVVVEWSTGLDYWSTSTMPITHAHKCLQNPIGDITVIIYRNLRKFCF